MHEDLEVKSASKAIIGDSPFSTNCDNPDWQARVNCNCSNREKGLKRYDLACGNYLPPDMFRRTLPTKGGGCHTPRQAPSAFSETIRWWLRTDLLKAQESKRDEDPTWGASASCWNPQVRRNIYIYTYIFIYQILPSTNVWLEGRSSTPPKKYWNWSPVIRLLAQSSVTQGDAILSASCSAPRHQEHVLDTAPHLYKSPAVRKASQKCRAGWFSTENI